MACPRCVRSCEVRGAATANRARLRPRIPRPAPPSHARTRGRPAPATYPPTHHPPHQAVLPAVCLENTTSGQLFAGPPIASLAAENAPEEFVQAQARAVLDRAAARAAEAASRSESGGVEHKLELEEDVPLEWTSVPHAPVAFFLRSALEGSLLPVKTLPTSGKLASPTPLAPSGHTEL